MPSTPVHFKNKVLLSPVDLNNRKKLITKNTAISVSKELNLSIDNKQLNKENLLSIMVKKGSPLTQKSRVNNLSTEKKINIRLTENNIKNKLIKPSLAIKTCLISSKSIKQKNFSKENYELFIEPIKVATICFFRGRRNDDFNMVKMNKKEYPLSLIQRIPKDVTAVIDRDLTLIAVKNRFDHIYLCFCGIENTTLLFSLNTIIKNVFGQENKSLHIADYTVKEFVKRYGKDNITLVGYSLGGAFSSYTAIKNNLPAVNINSMGLSRRIVNKLAKTHSEIKITNLNAKKDWLTQLVQRPFLKQVGERYKIAEFKGHCLCNNNNYANSLIGTMADFNEKRE